jgi:hypothetical protein
MNQVEAPYVAPKKQAEILSVSSGMADAYWTWFVNRGAYLCQRHTPGENGKHSYYAPREKPTWNMATGEKIPGKKLSLTIKDVEMHLAGYKTISLYAIESTSSTCKWIAIDADYTEGFRDLAVLQSSLREDGVQAVLEKSRRGGHLWVLGDELLPAAACRILVYNLALRLGVPIKGHMHEVEGIEVFPRQDRLEPGSFGNALRGPLGVHRASVKRYWFEGANGTLHDQFAFLKDVRRLTLKELETLTEGMNPIDEPEPPRTTYIAPPGSSRGTFDVRNFVTIRRKDRRNMWAQCPSCSRQGKDRGRDNLAIAVSDPRKYKCWAGCSSDDSRAACGYPPAIKRL